MPTKPEKSPPALVEFVRAKRRAAIATASTMALSPCSQLAECSPGDTSCS